MDAPFKLESLYLGQGSSGPSPLFFQLDRNSRGRKRRREGGGRYNLLGINCTMKSLCGGPAYSSSLCECVCVCVFLTYTFCVAFQKKNSSQVTSGCSHRNIPASLCDVRGSIPRANSLCVAASVGTKEECGLGSECLLNVQSGQNY